jgi:hypothetical protein
MMCSTTPVCTALALAAASSALTLAAPAFARDDPAPSADERALGTHQKHVRLDLGLRAQFVSSEGLDPFNERDYLPQLALGASYVVWTQDRLSLAGAFGFDYGSSSARARSNDASLELLRLSLGPEARYHLLRVLALTAKVAPALTHQRADVSTGLDSGLRDVGWKMGVDATVGVAVEVFGQAPGESSKPRVWALAEGGYGWTSSNRLVLKPLATGSAPQRFSPLTLPDLSLSGPLFKIGAALSF